MTNATTQATETETAYPCRELLTDEARAAAGFAIARDTRATLRELLTRWHDAEIEASVVYYDAGYASPAGRAAAEHMSLCRLAQSALLFVYASRHPDPVTAIQAQASSRVRCGGKEGVAIEDASAFLREAGYLATIAADTARRLSGELGDTDALPVPEAS